MKHRDQKIIWKCLWVLERLEGGFQDPEKLEVGKREEEEEAEREGSKGGRKPDFTTIAIGVDGSH